MRLKDIVWELLFLLSDAAKFGISSDNMHARLQTLKEFMENLED